jgi:hypothetical membrane protein
MNAPAAATTWTPARVGYWCGVLAGPIFIAAFIVEGAARADYDPMRHPVSSLAIGEYGWTQSANFVIAGLLTLGFAISLRHALPVNGKDSVWGPILVGVWAIGLIGAGLFVTDPVGGYPPGTPLRIAEYSTAGALHDAFSLPAFIGLAAASFVYGRRFARRGLRGWAAYSVGTGVVFVVGFILSSIGFDQNEPFADLAGLLQRLTVIIGWVWLTALAAHLLRHQR